MIKFLKVLAINCLIILLLLSTVWVGTGVIIWIICTYNSTAESFFLHPSPELGFFHPNLEQIHLFDNGDWIGFAAKDIKIPLMEAFPCALVITLSLKGRIAYSQTLAKSQRGRDFVERIKSLDISLGRALRKLVGNRT